MQNDCWRTFWYGITMYNSHRLVTLDLHWLPVVSVSCSSDGTMALRGSATARRLWAQGLHSEEAAELLATLTTSWERPIGLQLQLLQLLGTKKTRGWFLVISWFSWRNIDIYIVLWYSGVQYQNYNHIRLIAIKYNQQILHNRITVHIFLICLSAEYHIPSASYLTICSPDSDSYRGSYFQQRGRATNHFGGLDVALGCHCRVQWTWCHCWVPLQGAIVACYGGGGEGDDQLWGSGRGAIAGCHCRVTFQCAMVGGEGDDQVWGSGRGAIGVLWCGRANFGGVDVVTLLGAIAGCHCSVLLLGGGWRPTLGEWTWCHCWVPLQGAVDVVPLLDAIAGCHCSVLWWGEGRVTANFGGVDVVPLLVAM